MLSKTNSDLHAASADEFTAEELSAVDAHKMRQVFHLHVLTGQVVSEWVFARG